MSTWLVTEPQQLALDGEIAELDAWLVRGKLRVVGAEGPARVEVRKVGRKGITVTLDNGVLSLWHGPKPGPYRLPWFWWFSVGRRAYNADVIVAVPPSVVAGLTVVAGDVVAAGLRSETNVEATSGSIALRGLSGKVHARTVSGAIEAMGVSGDLGLETVSGEIVLGESTADRVRARTISGAITCDLDNPFATDIRLHTVSGSITVRVPQDADLDVSLVATSGQVTSAFPQVRPGGLPGHRVAYGRIGSGLGTLYANAVSGSVSLLARPNDEAAPEASAKPMSESSREPASGDAP